MSEGVSHRLLDQMVKLEAKQDGKIAEIRKVCGEVVEKHNNLAAAQVAHDQVLKQVAGFTASELGKTQGNVSIIGRSLEGIDRNVLALAELSREIIGQLTQVDALFKKLKQYDARIEVELTAEEVATIKADAEKWHKELLKSAFAAADRRIEEQRTEALQNDAAAKAAAEQAAVESQKMTVESELKNAMVSDRTSVALTSGGPGSEFPEGAEIFGG